MARNNGDIGSSSNFVSFPIQRDPFAINIPAIKMALRAETIHWTENEGELEIVAKNGDALGRNFNRGRIKTGKTIISFHGRSDKSD